METMLMTTPMPTPLATGLPPRRADMLPGGASPRAPLPDCEQQLAEACPHGVLPPPAPAAWAALAAVAQRRVASAGTLLLAREQPADALWLVGSGLVALGTRGESGLLQHRRSVGAGSWLDLASGLLGGGYAEDAVAESDCMLWRWSLADWQRVLRHHPALQGAWMATLAAEVHGLIEGTRGLMMKGVLARCATWLLSHAELPEGVADGQPARLRLQQRKRTIALQLGTTAETFSRTLHQLRRDQMIDVHGYDILLLDLPGLRRLADPQRTD